MDDPTMSHGVQLFLAFAVGFVTSALCTVGLLWDSKRAGRGDRLFVTGMVVAIVLGLGALGLSAE